MSHLLSELMDHRVSCDPTQYLDTIQFSLISEWYLPGVMWPVSVDVGQVGLSLPCQRHSASAQSICTCMHTWEGALYCMVPTGHTDARRQLSELSRRTRHPYCPITPQHCELLLLSSWKRQRPSSTATASVVWDTVDATVVAGWMRGWVMMDEIRTSCPYLVFWIHEWKGSIGHGEWEDRY